MNMDERLGSLPKIADEMLSDVQAGPQLKARILTKAAKGSEVRFRPLRATPAFCCALVIVTAAVWGIPSMLRGGQDTVVDNQPAGVSVEPIATMRADVPSGSLSLSAGSNAPAYRSIWASASGAYFPLIQLDGRTYRMLTTPSSLSSSKLGSALGTIASYTSEPSLSSAGAVSNVVLEGETVYAVSHMDGSAVAANVDGKMRVFQRVSFNGGAVIGGENLMDTLGNASVTEITLSGVGAVTDAASAQHLFDILTSSASYQSSGCQTTSQSLLIKFSNGVTLQLAVSGEKVMACGTWACPDFFAVFTEAL